MSHIDTSARDHLSALGPDPLETPFAFPSSRPAAPVFDKVLVADRGAVAVRVLRTLEELDIATAAVYSKPDARAPHVRRAREAHCIAAENSRNSEAIIAAARRCGADAIHPGYGPLVESEDLARACEDTGIAFMGPRADAIEAMRSRTKARALVSAAGIPVLPEERSFHAGRRIEVQILADAYGRVIHLGERGCSIRREEQSLIDESPAPGLDPSLRERAAQLGVEAARAIGWRSAGTVEGVVAGGEFHFAEINVRGQHSQSVSEMVSGVDIVREQVLIAAGWPLSFTQAEVWIRGHALACRISAEDASLDFAPAAGEITRYREPCGQFVRVDSGVEDGSSVLPDQDPTIATLVVWDRDREAATRRMLRALEDYDIEGPTTLLPFHRALLQTPEWASLA